MGASPRFYFSSRWAFQPEFSYLNSVRSDGDYLILPNFTVDFGQNGRVKPFMVFGVGYVRHSEDFGLRYVNTVTATAGCGVKMYLSKNAFVAPEVRLGSGAFLRVGVSVGYTFRRR